MWFATGHGVNRYDGYEIAVFQHIPTDSTTISSNTVRTILQDNAGNLWFGTNRGLNRLVARHSPEGNGGFEYFERYFFSDSSGRNPRFNNIRSLYQDSQQQIWIGTNGGPAKVCANKRTAVIIIWKYRSWQTASRFPPVSLPAFCETPAATSGSARWATDFTRLTLSRAW